MNNPIRKIYRFYCRYVYNLLENIGSEENDYGVDDFPETIKIDGVDIDDINIDYIYDSIKDGIGDTVIGDIDIDYYDDVDDGNYGNTSCHVFKQGLQN